MAKSSLLHTKGRGKLPIKFFEYSSSKEYDQRMGKPEFDLIIGCNSMERLGIVMNFKTKTITIDEIIF